MVSKLANPKSLVMGFKIPGAKGLGSVVTFWEEPVFDLDNSSSIETVKAYAGFFFILAWIVLMVIAILY